MIEHDVVPVDVAQLFGIEVNLSDVSAADYELIALPIKLKGADGAPARVVLRSLT